jgi:hypothetical protein
MVYSKLVFLEYLTLVTDAYPTLKRKLIQGKLRSGKCSREEHNQMRRQIEHL